MQQYEFLATNKKSGNKDQIRATACDEQVAFQSVNNYYGDLFEIDPLPVAVRPPHHIAGEIDCT